MTSLGIFRPTPSNGRPRKSNNDQFYSSEPLGAAELAERRVMAEIGSGRLLEAIKLYVERYHPGVLP